MSPVIAISTPGGQVALLKSVSLITQTLIDSYMLEFSSNVVLQVNIALGVNIEKHNQTIHIIHNPLFRPPHNGSHDRIQGQVFVSFFDLVMKQAFCCKDGPCWNFMCLCNMCSAFVEGTHAKTHWQNEEIQPAPPINLVHERTES